LFRTVLSPERGGGGKNEVVENEGLRRIYGSNRN
jgi:hypothetical protein